MSVKLLIVEDDLDILETLRELLQGEGYDVESALNGAAALELLKALPVLPDLILLDYMMPVMDGPGFRVAQVADPRIASIPVLLMTADPNPDTKHRQIGAKGFLKKPLDIELFLDEIRNCLK